MQANMSFSSQTKKKKNQCNAPCVFPLNHGSNTIEVNQNIEVEIMEYFQPNLNIRIHCEVLNDAL